MYNQFNLILKDCSGLLKERVLSIHDLLSNEQIQPHFHLSHRQIQYGKTVNKVFANIRRVSEWPVPKLFLRLPIPYAQKPGFRSELGWMSFETEDWQNIIAVYYHPKNKADYYYLNRGKRQQFGRLITAPEQEIYRNQNKSPLEMVVDKALSYSRSSS